MQAFPSPVLKRPFLAAVGYKELKKGFHAHSKELSEVLCSILGLLW